MVENLQAREKKGFQVFASKITVIIIEARKRLEKLFCLFDTDTLTVLTIKSEAVFHNFGIFDIVSGIF